MIAPEFGTKSFFACLDTGRGSGGKVPHSPDGGIMVAGTSVFMSYIVKEAQC